MVPNGGAESGRLKHLATRLARRWPSVLLKALLSAIPLSIVGLETGLIPTVVSVCEPYSYKDGEHCTAHNIAFFLWIETVKVANDYSPLTGAVATVIIAWFTFTLARVGRDQHDAAISAVNLARDEFNAAHRPKLHVRIVKLVSPRDDDIFRVCIQIVNTGYGVATIEFCRFNVACRDPRTGDWDRPIIPIIASTMEDHPRPFYTIMDGEVAIGAERLDVFAHRFECRFTSAPATYEICVLGEYRYRDSARNVRTTGFIWTWNEGRDRFEKSDDPEFSYED